VVAARGDLEGIFLARPEEPRPGIGLAVKDLFDTAGLTTTYGSILFADHVPTRTAEAVRRLEEAGYGIVGKTNLHEFAYGVTSENPYFGTVPNPLAPGRSAGGSSGGSAAALAAELADAALGTDTGGSIRIPAACCGIVGFKPTFGLVPHEGYFPLAPSFDHAGPMARSVADCARMLEILAPEFSRREPIAPEEVRLAVAWLDRAELLVRARVEEVATRFPRRAAIDLPRPRNVQPLFEREIADVHRGLFPEHAESYGEDVREKIAECLRVSEGEAEAAARERELYRERCLELLEGFDLLLTPTLAFVAPPVGRITNANRHWMTRFTFPFNALGWPALALPCGPAEDGLPASAQLVGRAGEDALVLAVGASLDRGTPGA
jgi:aspartyl-tRNA(Asn)/glutamyl-tRNA(Gln) amidotransferase subunit A